MNASQNLLHLSLIMGTILLVLSLPKKVGFVNFSVQVNTMDLLGLNVLHVVTYHLFHIWKKNIENMVSANIQSVAYMRTIHLD